MQEHEVLARCSTFPVLSPGGRLCWVTSAHSCCPWRYRQYFPDVWLDFVGPQHVRYTLEIRAPDGTALCQHLMGREPALCHPERDIALLRLADEPAARAAVAEQFGDEALSLLAPLELQSVADADALAAKGNAPPIVFCGHFSDERFEKGQDVSLQVPQHVRGRECARAQGRLYAQTEQLLQMGMCGGPALTQGDAAVDDGDNDDGATSSAGAENSMQQCEKDAASDVICIGALEGIVPPDFNAVPGIAGAALELHGNSINSVRSSFLSAQRRDIPPPAPL